MGWGGPNGISQAELRRRIGLHDKWREDQWADLEKKTRKWQQWCETARRAQERALHQAGWSSVQLDTTYHGDDAWAWSGKALKLDGAVVFYVAPAGLDYRYSAHRQVLANVAARWHVLEQAVIVLTFDELKRVFLGSKVSLAKAALVAEGLIHAANWTAKTSYKLLTLVGLIVGLAVAAYEMHLI